MFLMKNVKFLTLGLAVFALAALFVGCQKENDGPNDPSSVELRGDSQPISDAGVVPQIIPGANKGGNRTCQEVATYFGCTFDNSSANYNDGNQYAGTVGPISWVTEENGKYISWTSTVPVKLAVIAKGSKNANIYVYGCGEDDCATDDGGLGSPLNPNGSPAELSNITLCWTVCQEVNNDCEGETAYGGSSAGAGNAWWYYFDTAGPATQPIYAGQQLTDGTVTYENGQLVIALGANWQLQNVDESVKIQGYNTIPTKRPPSGDFETYRGNHLTVPVDNFLYYVIHLDVEYCE